LKDWECKRWDTHFDTHKKSQISKLNPEPLKGSGLPSILQWYWANLKSKS